jgi:hypothetical protein
MKLKPMNINTPSLERPAAVRLYLYSIIGALMFLKNFGDATFQLDNFVPEANINVPVYDAFGMPLEGQNYLAELFGGNTPEQLLPAVSVGTNRVQVPFLTGAGAGYVLPYNGVIIPGVLDHSFAWLQLRVWDLRLGSSYEEVAVRALGGYGESALFYARGGGALELPQPLTGLQSFRLRTTTPAVLMRSIRRQVDQIVLEWNPGFPRYQLQQTASLDQPWQNAGDPTNFTNATIPMSGPVQFFRVIGFLE